MFSSKDLRMAVLLTSGALLSAPLSAAIKTKPSASAFRTHVASHSKAASKPVSHKVVSHKAASHGSVATTSHHAHKSAGVKTVATKAVPAKPKSRGQQAIDSSRTSEIQEALIREHYMDGQVTGEWDQATRDALTRFQADHHWQTKVVPDSRALIMLGLGPSQQKLLNPESAAMTPPYRSVGERSVSGGSN
jgi:hypothetical protein